MMYDLIFEQLKDYCNCVDEFTVDDVRELIDIISMATGWTNKLCDNFLMGVRKEVIELPKCMDCAYTFEPFYTPFDKDDDGNPVGFRFVLVTQQGTDETEEDVTDFIYSFADENFRLSLPIPKCKCGCKCGCGCDPVYKLVATYNAGYTEIPECLLPVFCDLIQIVHAKNTCDCNDCQTCTNTYDEDSPGIRYYNGDLITVNLETDLAKVLVEQYKRQIGMISLYHKLDFWGIKV